MKLTRIGEYAFAKCSATSFRIPKSVEFIGKNAFQNAKELYFEKNIGWYVVDYNQEKVSVTLKAYNELDLSASSENAKYNAEVYKGLKESGYVNRDWRRDPV